MIGQYTTFLNENFDQAGLKVAAEKWLKGRFGDSYEFVHKPNLSEPDKTYHVSIDGSHFGIAGKKFDTNGDDIPDTICYKILSVEEEEEMEDFDKEEKEKEKEEF